MIFSTKTDHFCREKSDIFEKNRHRMRIDGGSDNDGGDGRLSNGFPLKIEKQFESR
jgi:hypothetical protein